MIRTSGSTIKGLAINRFPDNGISISGSGATGNRIEGNFVGTDASGTKDLGNGDEGVDVSNAPGNTIGGTVAAARNVISGNAGAGVLIQASEATGNRILGNFIGTNRGGTAGLGESSSGVVLQGVAGNTVGGASGGARNVISGNGGHGVMIVGSAPPAGNEVLGNFIGTDVTGREDQGNGVDGVRIDSAPGNTVGGTDSASRNVISGNSEHGIEINGLGATGNEVLGNFVGTNKGGTVALGNGGDGVQIENAPNNAVGGAEPGAGNVLSANREEGVRIILAGATGNEVEGNLIGTGADGTGDLGNTSGGVLIANAPGNTVGGAAREAGNVIAHSNFDGVLIFGTGATGNRVLSNRIFANGELGIDLVGNEVTGNDPDDGDTGPNNLQNFPAITSVTQSTLPFNPTTVSGTLNSVPSTSTRSQNFTVQCFAAAPDPAGRFAVAPDPSGHGEGVSFVAQDATVTTNDDGNATFDCNFFFPRELEGTVWSATATNQATGDTSEFSANFTVGSGP